MVGKSAGKQSLLGKILSAQDPRHFGVTALCPHGFLLLSEAGDGVSGIKKVAQGLEGGGPEFSVCFSCGARLQHKVVVLHLRRCCGASG